jgi:hypothetical protein
LDTSITFYRWELFSEYLLDFITESVKLLGSHTTNYTAVFIFDLFL